MVHLSANEALSGASGSVSLAAWIFVLVPQLLENYQTGSADGISLIFLSVWFVGDLANLLGSIWAGLVPTVIALAIYFCIADTILIAQCLYYRRINTVRKASQLPNHSESDDTTQPLLARISSDIGLPGSRRRSSASYKRRDSVRGGATLPTIPEDGGPIPEWLKNLLSVLSVCAVGALGWAIAWKAGLWQPTPTSGDVDTINRSIGALMLGYLSALCYLGARIPQIIKNHREKSCDGLSLLFFILSLLGNLTYGGGILFHSVSKQYLVTNLPWLIGSLGTMGEDILIFVQFRSYSREDKDSAVE